MNKNKLLTILKISAVTAAALLLLLILFVFGVNAYVQSSQSKRILTAEQAANLQEVDCILVLGCYVHPDGMPSDMLNDRLQVGIGLYENSASKKLLMSGDHGRVGYNEVASMKKAALQKGIPSSDVFMDHAGFSTYESLYRAKEVFGVKRVLIVTQEYHLYRALHVAKELGIEAWGVCADLHQYAGQQARDSREVLARVKDFFYGVFQPKPTYLGPSISIKGDADITNDDLSVFDPGTIT